MSLPKKPFTPEAAYTQAAARCATAEYCLNDWRRKFQMKGLKLLRFAAGRGYEPALIYQAVNRLCGEEGEEADEVFVEPDDGFVGPEEADNEF